ncbi:hypothetical protein OUZ56_004295 [Daphnia magna]|uniref:Uncharacterized protein n=1 Tax=Daphnia magna TaxID=35525 RepID=A0ABQ9YPI2_9CRUS|nr:hypothetical protein OUZ56_004295 [Daphnia magna]
MTHNFNIPSSRMTFLMIPQTSKLNKSDENFRFVPPAAPSPPKMMPPVLSPVSNASNVEDTLALQLPFRFCRNLLSFLTPSDVFVEINEL